MEAPEPVHVDVGMGHMMKGKGLCPGREGQQLCFRFLTCAVRQRMLSAEAVVKTIDGIFQNGHFPGLRQGLRCGKFGEKPLSPVAQLWKLKPVVFLLRFHAGNLVIHGHGKVLLWAFSFIIYGSDEKSNDCFCFTFVVFFVMIKEKRRDMP